MKGQFPKLIFGSALAMAFTLPIGQATFANKDYSDECHRKLEADRARIDRDVAKHGENSHTVDRDRDRIESDRQWCRDHHADWDHARFDVGVYIKQH
jgi:hypothetical protein